MPISYFIVRTARCHFETRSYLIASKALHLFRSLGTPARYDYIEAIPDKNLRRIEATAVFDDNGLLVSNVNDNSNFTCN